METVGNGSNFLLVGNDNNISLMSDVPDPFYITTVVVSLLSISANVALVIGFLLDRRMRALFHIFLVQLAVLDCLMGLLLSFEALSHPGPFDFFGQNIFQKGSTILLTGVQFHQLVTLHLVCAERHMTLRRGVLLPSALSYTSSLRSKGLVAAASAIGSFVAAIVIVQVSLSLQNPELLLVRPLCVRVVVTYANMVNTVLLLSLATCILFLACTYRQMKMTSTFIPQVFWRESYMFTPFVCCDSNGQSRLLCYHRRANLMGRERRHGGPDGWNTYRVKSWPSRSSNCDDNSFPYTKALLARMASADLVNRSDIGDRNRFFKKNVKKQRANRKTESLFTLKSFLCDSGSSDFSSSTSSSSSEQSLLTVQHACAWINSLLTDCKDNAGTTAGDGIVTDKGTIERDVTMRGEATIAWSESPRTDYTLPPQQVKFFTFPEKRVTVDNNCGDVSNDSLQETFSIEDFEDEDKFILESAVHMAKQGHSSKRETKPQTKPEEGENANTLPLNNVRGRMTSHDPLDECQTSSENCSNNNANHNNLDTSCDDASDDNAEDRDDENNNDNVESGVNSPAANTHRCTASCSPHCSSAEPGHSVVVAKKCTSHQGSIESKGSGKLSPRPRRASTNDSSNRSKQIRWKSISNQTDSKERSHRVSFAKEVTNSTPEQDEDIDLDSAIQGWFDFYNIDPSQMDQSVNNTPGIRRNSQAVDAAVDGWLNFYDIDRSQISDLVNVAADSPETAPASINPGNNSNVRAEEDTRDIWVSFYGVHSAQLVLRHNIQRLRNGRSVKINLGLRPNQPTEKTSLSDLSISSGEVYVAKSDSVNSINSVELHCPLSTLSSEESKICNVTTETLSHDPHVTQNIAQVTPLRSFQLEDTVAVGDAGQYDRRTPNWSDSYPKKECESHYYIIDETGYNYEADCLVEKTPDTHGDDAIKCISETSQNVVEAERNCVGDYSDSRLQKEQLTSQPKPVVPSTTTELLESLSMTRRALLAEIGLYEDVKDGEVALDLTTLENPTSASIEDECPVCVERRNEKISRKRCRHLEGRHVSFADSLTVIDRNMNGRHIYCRSRQTSADRKTCRLGFSPFNCSNATKTKSQDTAKKLMVGDVNINNSQDTDIEAGPCRCPSSGECLCSFTDKASCSGTLDRPRGKYDELRRVLISDTLANGTTHIIGVSSENPSQGESQVLWTGPVCAFEDLKHRKPVFVLFLTITVLLSMQLICWIPVTFLYLVYDGTSYPTPGPSVAELVLHVLALARLLVQPLLCLIFSYRYRREFEDLPRFSYHRIRRF